MAAPITPVTKTDLFITSKSRARTIARQALAPSQTRLSNGGFDRELFLHLVTYALTEATRRSEQVRVVLVAYPPHSAHDTWRVYTGEVTTVGVRHGRAVVQFADGECVPVDDVLAVTF